MNIRKKISKAKKKIISFLKPGPVNIEPGMRYLENYNKYAFCGIQCNDFQQYEAVITRLYHTIEKGLSYQNYRAGFGKTNIDQLLSAMEAYVKDGHSIDAFFYRTALSCLREYINKNAEYGYQDNTLLERVNSLPGEANDLGGSFWYSPRSEEEVKALSFEELICDRHSIRHFSTEPVDLEKLEKAIKLAQHTPSACNRQGWLARIITDKEVIKQVLENQNGNSGFGQEIDKLILVTGDLRYFNRDRETYQVYVDGGMYSANILNALHYSHLGTIPLSASLKPQQEEQIRKILRIDEAEVLILIIGVGNYPSTNILSAKSTRHEARYCIYS